MRLHYLQHVNFETPANIITWAKKKNISISKTLFFEKSYFPDLNEFDFLVIMGGPMNIYEEGKYHFLKEEKKFIEKSISNNKKVFGICLGAQLIADVLGSKVYKNKFKEIGWFPVNMTGEGKKNHFFEGTPEIFNAFHWHGDTFDIPSEASLIFSSEACQNQGFVYGKNTLGLQFHLESDNKSVDNLLKHCSDELIESSFTQNSNDIKIGKHNIFKMKFILENILNKFIYQ
jgi:GMP synthase-like glutamine amidotransferase